MSLYLESVSVPRVPVQWVLLLLRNVNRKGAHHLTTLLVASSAAAVSSSLLGCCIFCTKNKYKNNSVTWLVKVLFVVKQQRRHADTRTDVMIRYRALFRKGTPHHLHILSTPLFRWVPFTICPFLLIINIKFNLDWRNKLSIKSLFTLDLHG